MAYGVPNVTLTQVYKPGWAISGISPAWSVCVEISFYLLLPVYAALAQRFARVELWILGGIAALSLAFRLAVQSTDASPFWLLPLPGTLAWFTVGMALAVLSANDALRVPRAAWCWALAAALYIATTISDSAGATGDTGLFVVYGVIAGLVVAPATTQRAPSGRTFAALSWLGLVSYGIYLYHYPLVRYFHDHGVVTHGGLIVTSVAAAVACGAVSYYVIERPTLRLKRVRPRWWRSLPAR